MITEEESGERKRKLDECYSTGDRCVVALNTGEGRTWNGRPYTAVEKDGRAINSRRIGGIRDGKS